MVLVCVVENIVELANILYNKIWCLPYLGMPFFLGINPTLVGMPLGLILNWNRYGTLF